MSFLADIMSLIIGGSMKKETNKERNGGDA